MKKLKITKDCDAYKYCGEKISCVKYSDYCTISSLEEDKNVQHSINIINKIINRFNIKPEKILSINHTEEDGSTGSWDEGTITFIN